MAEPKWTPGPWEWRMHERYNLPALYGANGEIVMHFGDDEPFYPVNGQPPNPHNRALIAAAPDLYRELENLVELAEAAMRAANRDGGEYDIEAELAGARAALRKARGETT